MFARAFFKTWKTHDQGIYWQIWCRRTKYENLLYRPQTYFRLLAKTHSKNIYVKDEGTGNARVLLDFGTHFCTLLWVHTLAMSTFLWLPLISNFFKRIFSYAKNFSLFSKLWILAPSFKCFFLDYFFCQWVSPPTLSAGSCFFCCFFLKGSGCVLPMKLFNRLPF